MKALNFRQIVSINNNFYLNDNYVYYVIQIMFYKEMKRNLMNTTEMLL